MSRMAPRLLSGALENLTAALAPATTLARVQGVWEGVAGEAIAAAARPSAERGGVLTVTCAAAVWAQELDLMAGELIPRLNGALGEDAISELRCRTA
jgi:predicted nucleic acid-binding Zn ribbon protein